jgi:hypothetical protein
LESRLGRNMLLCHYHDIVAPLLLSRSSPRFSLQPSGSESGKGSESQDSSIDLDPDEDNSPLDWSHHWRLSLLTFAVRSCYILFKCCFSISNNVFLSTKMAPKYAISIVYIHPTTSMDFCSG